MKKTILITPQSFLDYKSLINKKYNRFKFKFVKGPINDNKKLAKYLKNVDRCIIGSEKLDSRILLNQKKLKVICRYGTNAENIDSNTCKKNKIKVLKLKKNINSQAVARQSLALLLNITNNLYFYSKISKNNFWKRKKNLSPEITKVGIIGMGSIGIIFARYLKLLKFKVNYYSRNKKKINYIKHYNSIKKLIKNSDIISIHLPSNSDTKKIFSEKIFKMLKGKILINTSRGDLLDEKIFYKYLKNRYIKFAALDVFQNEPTINISKKIRLLPNVISTCHSSFYDEETIKKMVFETLKKVTR